MKWSIACLAFLALGGCATPYQSTSFTGGFSETQLAPNVFRVKFRGNGYTSDERTSDFALLRAADLTLLNGYRYFGVAAEGTDYSSQAVTMPSTSSTAVTTSSTGNWAYATTTTTPGQTLLFRFPSSTSTIICFKENPNGDLFDASFVARSIRQKYRIKAPRPKSNDELDAEVREFLADPRYPHAREVSQSMVELLNSGQADTLQEAYALAVKQAGLE